MRKSLPFLLALGLVIGCSSDPTGVPPAPTPQPNDIDIVAGASTRAGAAFDPNPKTLALGGAANIAVRWVNSDVTSGSYGGTSGVVHHIVSDDGTTFDTGDIGGYSTASKTLTAGTYHFHCSIHPTMVGTLTITE